MKEAVEDGGVRACQPERVQTVSLDRTGQDCRGIEDPEAFVPEMQWPTRSAPPIRGTNLACAISNSLGRTNGRAIDSGKTEASITFESKRKVVYTSSPAEVQT